MKYNRQNPPLYGTLTIEEYETQVDEKSFPSCEVCENPILNPEFFSDGMCGPCTTGEAATIMKQSNKKPRGIVFAGILLQRT